MRIESITKENIKELPPIELRNIKLRFMRIYDDYFTNPVVQKGVGLDRETFFNRYVILRNEMKRRNIEYNEGAPIDKDKEVNVRVFLKSIYGIDIPSLGGVTIVKSYVAITGAFIKKPKGAKGVDVVVRNLEDNKDERLEKKISMVIKAHTGKEPNFIYRPEGPAGNYMPVFDLVLKARGEAKVIKIEKTKKTVEVKKPEENENTIRIPVGPECEVTATIAIDKAQGISALYCGKIKKIRTYLFDKRKKAWTMASANAWIQKNKEKLEKKLEATVEKKLSEAQQKEYDEETAKIRESAKKVKYPHAFKAAKWTWPNGHPRCIHCGEEEGEDDKGKRLQCSKPVAKFTIRKIDKKQQIVGGVVYEPDEIDTQGDYADAKEIEKAMYRFMEKYATDTKRIRISHKGKKMFFPIVESFIPEHDTIKGDKPLKAGSWWLEIKVTDPKIWDAIEKGTLSGFSMGGKAKA